MCQTPSTSTSSAKKATKSGQYKHIPHREKPPHLVARRNARERRRVQAVNSAFQRLRKCVPTENNRNKRLSKVKTLQKAIEYIDSLSELLMGSNSSNQSVPSSSGMMVMMESFLSSSSSSQSSPHPSESDSCSTTPSSNQFHQSQVAQQCLSTFYPEDHLQFHQQHLSQQHHHQNPVTTTTSFSWNPCTFSSPKEGLSAPSMYHNHTVHHQMDSPSTSTPTSHFPWTPIVTPSVFSTPDSSSSLILTWTTLNTIHSCFKTRKNRERDWPIHWEKVQNLSHSVCIVC